MLLTSGRIRFVLSFALAVALPGCGSSDPPGPEMAHVEGSVTLDGQPLESGEIVFALPGLPPAVIPVTKGAFAGEAGVGENKVRVNLFSKEPKFVDMAGEQVEAPPQNLIPPQYNVETTLKAQVAAGGPNEFQFGVTSR